MPRRQGNPLFGIFLLFLPFIIMIISKKRVIHIHNHPLHNQQQQQQQQQKQQHNDTLQKHFNDTLHKQQEQQHNDTLQVQNNDTLQEQQHNITKKIKSKINPDFMKMGEWNKIIQEPERDPAFCYDYFVIPERKKSHLYALLQ